MGSARYSQIDIAEKDKERYMYNPQEVLFPTLTVEDWEKELVKLPKNSILMLEGYTMCGNANTFKNAVKATKK